MSKPKNLIDHPAKFTSDQIDNIAGILVEEFNIHEPRKRKLKILDPYAGVGTIFQLQDDFSLGLSITAVEIEDEWASHDSRTIIGDSHIFMAGEWCGSNAFDAIITSFVFPNRMTDHHNAKDKSKRHTYKHYLGRDPSPESSATLGWGKEWKKFHREGFRLMQRVVRPNGLIILDSKNHFTDKGATEHFVNEWTIRTLNKMGMPLLQVRPVFARGLRHGKNYNERADRHLIIAMLNVK